MVQCVKCEKREDNNAYYNNNQLFGEFLCNDCWDDKRWRVRNKSAQNLIEYLELIRWQGLKGTIQGKIEEKKKEQKVLKVKVENKLENQVYLLENILEKQEDFDLVVFEDINQASRTFLRAQDRLQEAKDKLAAKLNSEEIEKEVEKLCEIQMEIGKLEIQQKTQPKRELEKEKFGKQIKYTMRWVKWLEWEQENLVKEVDSWKENYANQEASYEEKLTQIQALIKGLEAERATNYENFMDEYGKTIEDFYKRQGINTGDYKEHLQDYIFSRQLREENEQLKEQVKQMEKQLEAKVEIPPK